MFDCFRACLLLLLTCSFGLSGRAADRLDNLTDWAIYRGDKKGTQFSDLGEINATNVHRLEQVWEYHTGDADAGSSMQVNPIVVDGVMYFSTPSLNAVALDAATGEEKWVFKSAPYNEDQRALKGRTRGVVYWEDDRHRRIFVFVKHRVYAVDAGNGELVTSFGDGGHIDLRQHLDMDPAKASIEVTSPGIVYENFLIVASRVPEGYNSTPGHIRAFDTLTGEFRWIFHTIPQKGQFGYDTWEFVEGETYGGANAWGGFTVDEERGWVFCSTGSPANDFYGGYRKGQNLFGNCILALDAKTGERIWHYQTVHHDIWDYDNPPAPMLVTIGSGESARDAVVQFTKMGFTFVLDRETGESLFPVVEMAVPPSTVPGEEAWPTQPFPVKPQPLNRIALTEADLTQVSPEAHAQALEVFRQYRAGGIYLPPSTRGVLTIPGHQGGAEWGGGAYDPRLSVAYINVNESPSISRLRETHQPLNAESASLAEKGRALYENNCVACHGVDRAGTPPLYPSLLTSEKSDEERKSIIKHGLNMMPAFSQLSDAEVDAVYAYIEGGSQSPNGELAEYRVRYLLESYDLFMEDGIPLIRPPYGTLNAIDLQSGEILWKVPLGEYPQLVEKGIRNSGTRNFGGPVATAGGLVFIAATADEKIRAFEKHSGRVLWERKLPAGGYATPAVYQVDGRQYVVIAAGGGGKNETPSGDSFVAFALPEEDERAPVATTEDGWTELFDGESLDGWAHLNGFHTFRVEDGAIVGRTVEGSDNSFLCTRQTFADFELELEVWIDPVTNSGIQFRSRARPETIRPDHGHFVAGRVYGPQAEVRRRSDPGVPTTGVLYGEALGTGWLSSEETIQKGHDFYHNEAWNTLRIVARGPRLQTWVNGHPVEDIVREDVYATHPSGFIGLQVHGIEGEGPFEMKFRNIRIRPLSDSSPMGEQED